MPQMHPLLWASLYLFSLICLIFTISILFFSETKFINLENASMKPSAKKLNWKW